eukprot:TRINITY_DN4169_c0_g1_i2.p1 TRINITY_DN4169_c0_g1~~TRINITY_DN4169_c0_g1_i2.p1  ORF type:complete len:316 (+),score=47.20 TRINITY_DN4169_c0_g1_i2:60-1007(+)
MRRVRRYQISSTNNFYPCRGYCIVGPDWRALLLTVFLISIPSIFFLAFPLPFLTEELGPAVPVLVCLFIVAALGTLLRTGLSDPGIVPRASRPPPHDVDDDDDLPLASRPRPHRTKEVTIDGVVFKLKYCETCNIYRPPRCSHCGLCNNCVERFDHHCPWVGNCVGRRNYKWFCLFLYVVTILAIGILALCITEIWIRVEDEKKDDEDKTTPQALGAAVSDAPVTVILILYCFLCVWFVISLSIYHTYLVVVNETTHEQIKMSYSRRTNHFDKGVCRNCSSVFCVGTGSRSVWIILSLDSLVTHPLPSHQPSSLA